MADNKKIKTALVSVYHKENLDIIIRKLNELNVKILSTGGTKSFIESLGIEVTSVESLTGYPSILGRFRQEKNAQKIIPPLSIFQPYSSTEFLG